MHTLEIILDLPFGFPINNIISLCIHCVMKRFWFYGKFDQKCIQETSTAAYRNIKLYMYVYTRSSSRCICHLRDSE